MSSLDPNRLRLDPLDMVEAKIEQISAPLVVLKPIVESQNAVKLLAHFESAKAIWMFRHHKDVVSSNLRKFGERNGIKDIRPIVEDQQDNWRAQGVSASTREIICRYFSEDMNPADAAALFWFSRNRLFFEQGLDKERRVKLCKYDDLVSRPDTVVEQLYQFLGIDYPGRGIVTEVSPQSIGKGKDVGISKDIDELCTGLLNDLEKVYLQQSEEQKQSTATVA